MNSLRMSFWTVPASAPGATPCSSAATMYIAITGSTAPFMVIDTDIRSSGIPSNRTLHVLDRVDGDAGLADVAGDPRVVGVVAAVGREVERDGQPRLARFEVAAVERVRFLGGGVARVLAQGPGPAGVHRRSRAAHERREARQGIEVLHAFEVRRGVERLDLDAFRGPPRQVLGITASGLLLDEGRPGLQDSESCGRRCSSPFPWPTGNSGDYFLNDGRGGSIEFTAFQFVNHSAILVLQGDIEQRIRTDLQASTRRFSS